METASKDVLFTVAMKLDLPNLLRWCSTSSRINRDVCNNDNLWRAKLLKDYPDGYPDYQIFNMKNSLREMYIFLYQLSWIKKVLQTNESIYDIFLKEKIHLSRKGLKKLPAFDLPNLQSLSLYGNQLIEVPDFNLPRLQSLSLEYNQLTAVPAFHLPKLQILFLNHNQLTEVPAFDLPNLQQLYLSNNQLTEVPAFDLPNLQRLYLHNNQLTEVPAFNLPKLQIFYLYNNQLKAEEQRKVNEKYRFVQL